MNALEMQYAFEIRANQIDRFDFNRLDTDRIQDFLNLSQRQELQDKYSKLIGSPRTKFDATEKIRRELGNLISSKTIENASFDSTQDDLHSNAFFVTLPSDYLYGVEERCVIDSDGSTGVAKVVPITYDEYIENIDNPFLEPYEELAWRLDYGITGVTGAKRHEIIYSSDVSVQSYTVRYVRRPQKIKIHPDNYQDCELDESLHDNIVNRAVQLAVGRQTEKSDNE